jgi:hypothetical protein
MSMLWHPTQVEHGLSFHLDNNFVCQTVDLRIAKTSAGQRQIGKIEFVETAPESRSEPTLQLDNSGDNLQYLFNALWEFGLRPPERARKDDILSAKDDHLDDLRKILFNQFSITEN